MPRFRLSQKTRRRLRVLRDWRVRTALALTALLMLTSVLIPVIQPYLTEHTYEMGNAEAVLPKKDPLLASKLQYKAEEMKFLFNGNYFPGNETGKGGGPKISAVSYADPEKGLSVVDPVSNVELTITPKFKLLPGKQDSNRIVYPLLNGTGWLVYTMQAGSVKEDVVLRHANGDKMDLEYELKLGDALEARLTDEGDVAIYGSSLPITGNVSTGGTKDVELLKKARKNAPKDKLLFTLPAPVAYGANQSASSVRVYYELKGNMLKTVASGLKQGRYPLTIDPTVTVTAATDLFRDTNPDSNVDFDATTGNISRGAVTGGVIPAWSTNGTSLNERRFLHSSVIYDDYAYIAGGAGVNTVNNKTTIEYARLSDTDATIGAWASTTSLPAGLSRFQLLAYNGYLYAVGGSSSTTNCSSVTNTVYYNRIQANGQLSGSWSSASTLPSAVCGLGAAVYDGKMYIAGGRTGSAVSTGVTTVAYATIKPDGSLSSWSTDDSVLPQARYDHDVQIYNGYIYVIGGHVNGTGTLTNTVLYAPLASDGSIYGTGSGSWKSASSFGTARSNLGSRMSAGYDGYMYIQGGCSTFNGSQACTAVRSEIQIAQINADGSLGPWSDVSTSIVSLSRVGNSMNIWRGTVYSFAGCTTMNGASITCANSGTTIDTQSYSTIKEPGEVGPVNTTTALPTGLFAHAAVVNNGYLYVIGGCITNSCQTGVNDVSGDVRYAAISADGAIGSWTLDPNTLTTSSGTGLAAMAASVTNNWIVLSGGYRPTGARAEHYRVQLNDNGSLAGAWAATGGTSNLSAVKYYASSIIRGGFLYVFGGCTASTGLAGCSNYQSTVQRFTVNTNTGGISGRTTLSSLPVAKALMAPALYNGYIYLAGGATSGSAQTNNVYYARINDNGSMGSWNTATGTLTNDLRRADAVAMNGYLYVFGGHNGATNTTYGDIDIGKIDMATGDIPNNFINSVIEITPRWDERAAFANGYIYATGGCSVGPPASGCTTRSTLVEYVEVFNASNKGTSWANSSNVYSTNRTAPATTAYNGYIYVAGGCTSFTVGTGFGSTFCSTGNNTTAYAALNPDGSIGTWTAGPNLTASNSRVGGCLVAQGGYLYYVGGEDSGGTAQSSVLYSQIGSNGVPGAWTQSGTSMASSPRAWHACAVFADRIYVTGGLNASSSYTTTSYYSDAIPNGGDVPGWTSGGISFATARGNHTTVIVGGHLFVMGGDNGGTNALMDLQSIQINPSTGALIGSWQEGRDLPSRVSYQSAIAANGYIYLFGGRTSATNCIDQTYITSVNSSGRTGEWSVAADEFPTARFGTGAAFYNGYYYMLGGNTCSGNVTTNVIQYGGQKSQAMKGLLSKYADLAGNGKPRAFVAYLTNAVNGGVDIEKWRLKYRSSYESTNDWGAVTTVHPVTSEQTYAVSSLNGAGTDIQLSRWFWFSLEMNMEQSFMFTDDTQPTIYQYELHYSPPPSKRLMHGRDFRDQTQQGLDASPL